MPKSQQDKIGQKGKQDNQQGPFLRSRSNAMGLDYALVLLISRKEDHNTNKG